MMNSKPPTTIAELEQLTTHELADLVSNIVLILRRLPNVPVSQLTAKEVPTARETPDLVSKAKERVNGSPLPDWTNQD
jgi:hypothetical protein